MEAVLSIPRSLVSIALLAGLACGRSQGAPAPATPGALALSVRVAPVVVKDVVFRFTALGSLEAEELIQVTAEVEGAVSQVLFHEGDRVTPQTVLLRIDPDRYRLEVERADASWRRAVADERRAEADLRRRESLAKEQLVADEELNRSRQEAERLQADAAAAKAALDIAKQNQAKSDVRAPHNGVIDTKAVSVGQFVKLGNVLATLVDTRRLRLRFKVSEAESIRARVGDRVGFAVAALGKEEFEARIYHVGQIAEPTTRQVEVMAWVQNPGRLKPGFFAEVTLAAESRKDAKVVPEGAVQASEKGFVAYVVEGGKAKQRLIQIGLRTAGGVEILSGLNAGETVVIEGSDRLGDGVAVQVAAERSGP